MKTIEELHPGATDFVELFGVSYTAEISNEDDVLNNRQRFVLEGRGRDVEMFPLKLEYDQKTRPMLKAI